MSLLHRPSMLFLLATSISLSTRVSRMHSDLPASPDPTAHEKFYTPPAPGQRTVAPQPPVQAPATQECDVHTVQYDDVLWRISKQYQLTVNELLAANPSIDRQTAAIYPGQNITIPCTANGSLKGTGNAALCTGNYTVVSGDTLFKIASQYRLSLQQLMDANPQLLNPDVIFPRDIIFIPPCRANNSTPPAVAGSKCTPLDAVVQPNDYLYR